jgi:hypothetical protein
MRGVARAATVALRTAIALSVAIGCGHRPAPGGTCRVPDQVACDGTDHAFFCESNAWVMVPCHGQGGCARQGTIDECDDTVATEGERCPHTPPVDYACTADRAKALVCKDGRFALWRACRGPEGCQVVGGRNVRCDTTLGEPDDPCAAQGTYSCSADRKGMLLCDGSKLAAVSSCRGPAGCRVERELHKVDCDDSVALEGDPCDKPSRIACSMDSKSELVCAQGRYAKKRACRRSDCRFEGSELFCD